MSVAVFLKNNVKNIPPVIGKTINKFPYDFRPGVGGVYRQRKFEIAKYDSYSLEERQNFVFQQIKSIVNFAYQKVPAYKDYYNRQGFHPDSLLSFDDIKRIPLTSKSILNQYPIEERSYPKKGRYIVNTGGSSGTPFGFYIEPSSMGHEWAHMHTIWNKLGFKVSDLKLVFGGRSNIKNFVDYDAVRNSFGLDLYADYKDVSAKLKKILKRYKIKYLHGYPSSIYDFAVFCNEQDNELRDMLAKQLKGAFMGSEFPHPHYREVIENVFGIDTISWYGHTERCVLAYEKNEKFVYEPFQTYGYAEEVNSDGKNELVATSYYNEASPLIRYNTNDEITETTSEGGILQSFQMKGGRSGEFVIDRDGKKINLTGLIFGRHHELFNESKYIQVKQIEPGVIEIHYVANALSADRAATLFDSNNVNMDISFVQRDEPVRTVAGKVGLLIK
jgi:phenylacetate-CoA ligase